VYTASAVERRRCQGTRRDGTPCCGWAMWTFTADGHFDPDTPPLCNVHAGRHHAGPRGPYFQFRTRTKQRTRAVCRCEAMAWPHRPGSGTCQWPALPSERYMTPSGHHAWTRAHNPLKHYLRKLDGYRWSQLNRMPVAT